MFFIFSTLSIMILEIARICQTRRTAIDYLFNKKIRKDNKTCGKCENKLKITTKNQVSDGIVWQCSKGCQSYP